MRHPEPARVRKQGTKVYAPLTPEARIAAFRSIVAACQYAKIDGVMVDLFSASAVVSIYDALGETNRLNFASRPAPQMASIAFKLLNAKGAA